MTHAASRPQLLKRVVELERDALRAQHDQLTGEAQRLETRAVAAEDELTEVIRWMATQARAGQRVDPEVLQGGRHYASARRSEAAAVRVQWQALVTRAEGVRGELLLRHGKIKALQLLAERRQREAACQKAQAAERALDRQAAELGQALREPSAARLVAEKILIKGEGPWL